MILYRHVKPSGGTTPFKKAVKRSAMMSALTTTPLTTNIAENVLRVKDLLTTNRRSSVRLVLRSLNIR